MQYPDVKKIYEHIRYLSEDCDQRWFGTEGNLKARQYIEANFENLNLVVSKQVFEEYSAEVISSSVKLLDYPEVNIEIVPILNTEDTPAEGIMGEIVYVEGMKKPQIGKHLEGKIVLWMPELLIPIPTEILQHKPLAVLMISTSPGMKARHDFYPSTIISQNSSVPSFRISNRDALKLLRINPKKLHINYISNRFKKELGNIFIDIPGTKYPEEIVVIGAHLDGPPDVPAATDNAAGVALMLELARVYSGRETKRTLRFAAWDGEEAGVLGSYHYLEQLKNSNFPGLDNHMFYINFDTLGNFLGYHTCSVNANKTVENYLYALGNELGIPLHVNGEFNGSDHDLFAIKGIPSINFSRMGPAYHYIHTIEDTINLVGINALDETARLGDLFIRRAVAESESWLFEREIPEYQIGQINWWKNLFGFRWDS